MEVNPDSPPVVELAERVAQWCINRAMVGDVSTPTLVENFAKLVTKIIEAKKH